VRAIKVRAWIPDEDSYNEETGLYDRWSMTYDLAFEEFEPINQLLAGVEHLMQYTGLKDKNGKEIYEGDIVRFDNSSAGIPDADYRQAVVQYRAPEFMPHHLSNVTGYDVEVIGNIYENPELLKDKAPAK
jgi:uncharacterized phage protein (TIGR01671 family)